MDVIKLLYSKTININKHFIYKDKRFTIFRTYQKRKMGLIPSDGFSLTVVLRGVLGMLVLLFIAYLLSNNRKAIAWKTVGVGLLLQITIAIGVIKVPWVTQIFETLGGFFIRILDYTGEGAKMLLGSFGDVEVSGFIFVFQALPVIIFFSALTSVLYYYRIIQKVVSGLAWMMTKFLNISGQESLAVAGNIFLGQTEAPLLVKGYLNKK